MYSDDDGARRPADYLAALKRRRWTALGVFTAVFGLMAAYAFLTTPIYRASSLVTIEKVSDVVTSDRPYQLQDEDYLATQAKLIVSETALRKVFDDLKLGQTDEFAMGPGALKNSATVLAVPRTRLVYVNAESRDPKTAAKIANALAENFVNQNLENQLFMPKDVLAVLRTRAKGPNATRVYESLPQVIGNPLLQDLKSQILKGELALTDLRSKYTPEHPAVQALEQQIKLIRQARARELDTVVRSVTTALSGQLRPNNVRIIDPALEPRKPARPRRDLALFIGLAGGALLAIVAALALDGIDETVRTPLDLERKLGLPFLGEIPYARVKKGARLYAPLVAPDPTVASEAFRELRTLIAISKLPSTESFLLVTSATQDEGKTFVATNLAVALAQLGSKVLLIDGDLRRPSIHRHLLGSDGSGLSEFLSGRGGEPDKLAQKTEIANLHAIAAGKLNGDPSRLLSAGQLEGLIAWARQRYDRVIVDCPPVFPVGDVLLWGRHVRPSILVSRCGRTPVPVIQLACERLRAGGVDVLGGVLNASRAAGSKYVYQRRPEKPGAA